MGKLLKAEFFKLSKSIEYKILLAVCLAIGLLFGIMGIWYGSSTVGAKCVSISGTGFLYNAVLISMFAAYYIGSEFENHTFAGEVACGASRGKLFGAKMILYFIAILPLIMIYDWVTVAVFTVRNGFGMDWNLETAGFIVYKILFSILCNFAMGSYILLVVYLTRDKGRTVGVGVGSLYLLNQCCINERSPVLLKFWQYTFFYQIDCGRGLERPMHFQVSFHVIVISSLVFITGAVFFAAWKFKTYDLK